MPTQFPALLRVDRVVSTQALVSFRGNRYSVPPNLHGASVTLTVRLDGTHLDIAALASTTGALPTVIARHLLAPTGAGMMVRDHGHVTDLNQAAMNAATTTRPHRGKQRLPPTPAARAEAAALRTRTSAGTEHRDTDTVVDLARYTAAAAGRNTLHTTQATAAATAPTKNTPTPSTQTTQPGTTIKEIDQP